MSSRLHRAIPIILLLVAISPRHAATAAEAIPPSATVLDGNLIMYSHPYPLISPDGKRVAYVSRGFVCVADIETAKSRQLFEVPESWTHFLALPENAHAGGSFNALAKSLTREQYRAMLARIKNEIGDFQWTANSDAVVFAIRSHDAATQTTQAHIWRVSLDGEAKEIASSQHSLTAQRGPGGMLTRDGRFLVGNSHKRALIWDLATNKPRATPYLYLASSPASGRWIGVEKDTRQLVVLDEDFNVSVRHDEILPENDNGFDMIWSPDERFVIWRQQIGFDHYSNWTGCRLDLKTRDRQVLAGDYMSEKITFTGNRGEFIRVGGAGVQGNFSGLVLVEQYVALVPDGRLHMQPFWQQTADPPGMQSEVRMGSLQYIVWAPDFQLFTMGLPRQKGPHGEIMHLADRQRRFWKMPGGDTGGFISPYHVAGFALGGKSLIAYDETRLFSLPIAAIQTSANLVR